MMLKIKMGNKRIGFYFYALWLSIAPSAIGTTDIITTGFNLWAIAKVFPSSPVGMADFKRLKICRPYGTLVDFGFCFPWVENHCY